MNTRFRPSTLPFVLTGQGRFTEVYEGEWDRKRGDVQKAAIKMLSHNAPPQALQVSGKGNGKGTVVSRYYDV